MNIDYIAEFAVLAQIGNYLEASELLFISPLSALFCVPIADLI